MGDEEGKSNGDSTECSKEVRCLKSEANGFEFGNWNGIAKGSSGASEGVRTYKRRRHMRPSWDSRSPEDGGADVEYSSQLADQCLKEPVGTVMGNKSCEQAHLRMNSSDACSERHWRNTVLENMYRSLGNDEGGLEVCIREALIHFREIDNTARVKEFGDYDVNTHQLCVNRPQDAGNGQAGFISDGYSNKSNHHTVTAKCQHAFFNVLVSEKFATLCKLLLENFQGIKADSIFDLKLINSRMKKGEYENSPMLFSADMQQVWRKLHGIGTDLISLSKSLSEMSRTSCDEQVGGPVRNTFEGGKNEFCTKESDSYTKREQTEDCGVHTACTCRRCGKKAGGKDFLVCDSCEDMYHVSCIEPAVKEIPTKSWYCVSCTGSGARSSHENCFVCEKLNLTKTSVGGVGAESVSTDEETVNEMVENSNCSTDDGIQLSEERKDVKMCKVCGLDLDNGEKVKICGHPYCPKKYYHVRCLTTKQLKLYATCWYCYSCLCRACLTDQDDHMIVLCDGCDHGYHMYCVHPKLKSVPTGKWFCRKCDAAIKTLRRVREAYDKNRKKQAKKGEGSRKLNEKGEDTESEQGRGGMEVLLYAVKTLNHEEDMKSKKE